MRFPDRGVNATQQAGNMPAQLSGRQSDFTNATKLFFNRAKHAMKLISKFS